MKEDVLEQIVDDYLQLNGYFTVHNVRFRPRNDHPEFSSKSDSVTSDIDILGVNPRERGKEKVVAVSCKAWQEGFDATYKLKQLRGDAPSPKNRPMWKFFREIWVPKWSEAFFDEVERRTGTTNFTYLVAVTSLRGDPAAWNNDPTIKKNMKGNPVGFLTLEKMWSEYMDAIGKTPQPSAIGRLAQLLKAAKLGIPR